MYIDLDHFKQINDELGHAAGDEVLREAAKRIQASLRRNDLVARLGGDELVAILEDTDTAQAMELARRLQRSFAEPLALVPDRAIAASIGVASYPEDATSAEELLSRADEAMYRVKRLGRGEVASHGEQTGELQGLDEPSSCIESQIERGSVVARRRPLFSLSGQELDILEVEPALATSERISLDAETLRRLAAPSHLSLALHRRLFSLAEEVCRKEQRPALVTLSDAFCRANDDLASLCNRLARESSRVCVGLPQRFLQADPEHASDTITALRERGSRVFVADFGASGADVALISRLLGLDGLCLDGYLLRELSVERGRVQAFLDVVQSLGTSLSLEILVREQDRALCVRSPRSC
jgi:diguanylate cyclase (GGDEF)-like protein